MATNETLIAEISARELIDKKLDGQTHLLRKHFPCNEEVEGIDNARARLARAESNAEILSCEANGAQLYWTAWHEVPVSYPRVDLPRIPDHWRSFGSRMSPLTTSPRLAVNPPNAMLNYLYAILEAEARLALASLGLDPGIGMLHSDLRSRDSLACDLMEPVRPQVDAFLLGWLNRGPLRRDWFFEQGDGNCRLMAPFAARLSESAEIWRRAVAPFAEGIARALWSQKQDGRRSGTISTPLTQSRKRESRGSIVNIQRKPECAWPNWHNKVPKAVEIGRDPIAQARRAETQRRQNRALNAWKTQNLQSWIDESFFQQNVRPRLGFIPVRTIQSEISVSQAYALRIRSGKCIPHRRHWPALAKLVGV